MTPEEQERIKAGAANAYDFGYAKTPAQISSVTVAPVPQLNLTPKPDTTDYTSGIVGGNASIADNSKAMLEMAKQAAAGQADSSIVGWIQNEMNRPAPSGLGAYDTATGTTEAERSQALTESQTAAQQAKARVRAAQAEVAGYQAQLESIVAEKDKTNLQLENQANQNITSAGGAGAVMNTGFLSTQQQKVNREAAIKALPIQGLALAAQAKLMGLQGLAADAQDTLKMAQDKFDKAFDLKIADNNRAYEQRQDNLKFAFNYFTEQEKNVAQTTKERLTRNNTAVNSAINEAKSATTDPQAKANIFAIPAPNAFGTDEEVTASIQKYNEAVGMELAKVVAKPDVTAAAGSIEEFQILKGRLPVTTAELNEFSKSRKPISEATAILNALRELKYEDQTATSPGQLVNASTGRPLTTGNQAMKDRAVNLNGLRKQIDVIQNVLDTGIQTGAISGWVTYNGITVPALQNTLDPKMLELQAQMIGLFTRYVYAMTGAQVNQLEFEQASRITPSVKSTPENNNAIIRGFKSNINNQLDSILTGEGWKFKEGDSSGGTSGGGTGGVDLSGLDFKF